MTVAETVAAYLAEREIPIAFGLIGAGNAAIFDAIARLRKTEIISMHHEQACTMAANGYFRASGKPTVAIVTTGAGSTNALTGLAAAHMDSVPLVVLAGNEPLSRHWPFLRAYGVQGYNGRAVAEPICKLSLQLRFANQTKMALKFAFDEATKGRPGPVWLDLPQDVQVRDVIAL